MLPPDLLSVLFSYVLRYQTRLGSLVVNLCLSFVANSADAYGLTFSVRLAERKQIERRRAPNDCSQTNATKIELKT